jgi:orotate phosphoribosyltransferase-like protein
MKDQDTVQKFIELRSKGMSFARLAEELGVAKSTLILWSQKYQHLIHNLRTIEWEEFVDRTVASKQERLQSLTEQLRRIETELAQRDLTSVSTQALQSMAEQLRRRIERECGPMLFSAGVELSRDDATRDAIQDWKA